MLCADNAVAAHPARRSSVGQNPWAEELSRCLESEKTWLKGSNEGVGAAGTGFHYK